MSKHYVRLDNIEDDSNDEDLQKTSGTARRSCRKTHGPLRNMKESDSSDSDEVCLKPRRTLRSRESKEVIATSPSSEGSSSDNEKKSRNTRKKRIQKGKTSAPRVKRRKIMESSSDESEESSEEEKPRRSRKKTEKKKGKRNTGRRRINKIIAEDELLEQTKEAAKEEEERLKRLEEREKSLQSIEEDFKQEEEGGKGPCVILQNNPLVEVTPYLAKHLRPHQVEGVRFIWDNLIESTDRASTNPGGGCILAHCMGLGKTLQTITSVHTMLKCKHLSFKCCLVVAPLNTVRNWIAEFIQWCEDGDELPLYNFADCRSNKERILSMRSWRKDGGVLIMGYDMYRIMATKTKYKAWKDTVQQCLIDPGPDIVVCDEGHMLKNATSHISKKLNMIKTKRRLVLTGTPLQNNLTEYHCMVNFVKPDLLGSLKEFRNRFVNPIVNGQHTDSTAADVNVMKKRSHVLHQMLQGFVQRKDYSALKSYLSTKYEYVLKVRLTPLQISIYQHYLDTMTNRGTDATIVNSYGKGASLFSDYQNLMRVWTHPKSMLMHTEKREKMEERAMNNFIIHEEEEAEETNSETEEWTVTSSGGEGTSKKYPGKNCREESEKSPESDDGSSSDNEKMAKVKPPNRRTRQRANMRDEVSSDEDVKVTRSGSRRKMKISDDSSFESASDSEESVSEEEEMSGDGEMLDRSARLKARNEKIKGLEDDVIEPEEEKIEEWYASLLPEDETTLNNIENSSKITLLFEILRQAEQLGEKVLVFSQSLVSLDLIEEMLASTWKRDKNESDGEVATNPLHGGRFSSKYGTWYKNIDYFRMDGSTQGHHRQRYINAFNDEADHRSRLFLISTKAGSLGVNLVGANRVVIFDASWNPSHDTQSMFRVYRFGQTKKCYIYRLIAEGTMEEKIYQRQVNKQSLSIRVIDEQQINRYFTASSLAEMYTFNPTTPESDKDKSTPIVPKDDILAEILLDPQTKHLIASYHEHDSLLDHQVGEELTEAERKAAWEEYELEKKRGEMPQMSFRDFRPAQPQNAPLGSNHNAVNMNDALMLMARVNKLMQNAYIKVRSHETKPTKEIITQLKNTPLYANTPDETLQAIAVEVNFRLSLKRDEAQIQFDSLQEQYKLLQQQYFHNISKIMANGSVRANASMQSKNSYPQQMGMMGTSNLAPGLTMPSNISYNHHMMGSSVPNIPTRELLLQQMGSMMSSHPMQNGNTSAQQTSTTLQVIEISDSEEKS